MVMVLMFKWHTFFVYLHEYFKLYSFMLKNICVQITVQISIDLKDIRWNEALKLLDLVSCTCFFYHILFPSQQNNLSYQHVMKKKTPPRLSKNIAEDLWSDVVDFFDIQLSIIICENFTCNFLYSFCPCSPSQFTRDFTFM